MLELGSHVDGYRILRRIGSGGFGHVFLCQNQAVGDFRALKFIPASSPDLAAKELQALVQFRKAVTQCNLPSILPIEHVRQIETGLFYVMPLSDGCSGWDPADASWKPWTLEDEIIRRCTAPTWFSTQEICALLLPILEALQGLSDAGLVHRDVKPANILKLSGKLMLADLSLLGPDSSQITRRGTAGYVAPSWFLEAGGHPDMYGFGATLYTLLTGNPPDKMGRSAYNNPPQEKTPNEKAEHQRLLNIVTEVTERPAKNPYHNFRVLGDVLPGTEETNEPVIEETNKAPEIDTHKIETGPGTERKSEQRPEKYDRYAIASFCLGISIFVPLLGLLTFIPTIIFGHLALRRLRNASPPRKGRLLAIISLGLSYGMIAIGILGAIFGILFTER